MCEAGHPVGDHKCETQFLGAAQVTIGSEDLKANHMIQQVFHFPQEFEKYPALIKLLEKEMDGSRLLVRFLLF